MSDELKQQLTAAEEQLAEMREALNNIREIATNPATAFYDPQPAKIAFNAIAEIADKALSAAPKRGRVLFQGEGFFARVPPDSVGMWHCVDGTVMVDFLRDIAAKDDQLLTVTVREAE